MSYVLCLMSYVLCLMSYVLCLMSYVLCLISYVLCIMSYVLCLMSYVLCLMSCVLRLMSCVLRLIPYVAHRVLKITKLPRKVMYGCEHMQVVRYTPFGHYHAHHDSETHSRTDVPCCHFTDPVTVMKYGRCKLCRYIPNLICFRYRID